MRFRNVGGASGFALLVRNYTFLHELLFFLLVDIGWIFATAAGKEKNTAWSTEDYGRWTKSLSHSVWEECPVSSRRGPTSVFLCTFTSPFFLVHIAGAETQKMMVVLWWKSSVSLLNGHGGHLQSDSHPFCSPCPLKLLPSDDGRWALVLNRQCSIEPNIKCEVSWMIQGASCRPMMTMIFCHRHSIVCVAFIMGHVEDQYDSSIHWTIEIIA